MVRPRELGFAETEGAKKGALLVRRYEHHHGTAQSITTGGSDECGSPKAAVEDLIAKVVGGKALEAFDRYYADDVTMQENEQPPRVGKAACRTFEEDFLLRSKRCGPTFATAT